MSLFNNLKIAYQGKSNYDLNRAYILFKIINYKVISKIITSLLRLLISVKIPIDTIVKLTVYKHFCGGTSIEDSKKTINKLWDYKIGTILNFSAEGKKNEIEYKRALSETLESIEVAKNNSKIPFAVFKPTSLIKFNLLENKNFSEKEKLELNLFHQRINIICKKAYKNRVPVFIDAEESWIQDAIDDVVYKMMKKYNKKNVWIFNTIQTYRIDSLKKVDFLIKDAQKNKYLLGLKIVRGAYHEKEIKRANEKNYQCPVFIRKKDTDASFDNVIKLCIKNIDLISICAGTHNEQSSELLIKLMKKNKISKNDKRIYFSQLLGMSDNISYNAAHNGYNVAKYVPYGPVKDLIPYLIRRAEENTSIAGQTGRELNNIVLEKNRRKKTN